MRLIVLLVVLVGTVSPLAAQVQGPPTVTVVEPVGGSTRHLLNPRMYVEYAGYPCIDDGSGTCDPNPATLEVRVNGGANLAGKFSSWTKTDTYATNGTGITGSDTLSGGVASIYVKICNGYSLCDDTTVTVTLDAQPQQRLYLDGHAQTARTPGRCAAVPVASGATLACDGLT